MAKQRGKAYGVDPTTITLMVACFVGICVLYSLEFVYRAFRDSTPGNSPLLPSWRAHMGSVCVGMAAFVIVFFFPEVRGQTETNSLARSLIVVVARGANRICYCCPHSVVCSCVGMCRLRLVGVSPHASGHSNFDLACQKRLSVSALAFKAGRGKTQCPAALEFFRTMEFLRLALYPNISIQQFP
jgi:hypothetical protein